MFRRGFYTACVLIWLVIAVRNHACEPPDCDREDCGTCGEAVWRKFSSTSINIRLNISIFSTGNACCALQVNFGKINF